MGKHLEQALPSVYTLQCLTGKVDNNNNITSVLHLDRNPYYGEEWGTLMYRELTNWITSCQEPSRGEAASNVGDSPPPAPVGPVDIKPGEKLVDIKTPVLQKVKNVTEKIYAAEIADVSKDDIPAGDEKVAEEAGKDDLPAGSEEEKKEDDVPHDKEAKQEVKEDNAPAAGEQAEGHKEPATPAAVQPSPITWDSLGDRKKFFNFDIMPKLLLARGGMVDLLSNSTISKYLEFRATGAILQYSDGKLGQVPCSRTDLFATKSISLLDKRKMMKFLQFCAEYEQHPQQYEAFKGKPFGEFLNSQGLTPALARYVLHSIAMVSGEVPTEQGLSATHLFLHSLGRFGNTPFLYPVYGCGELPQAFCRFCAVFAGVYVLRRSIKSLILNENNSVAGIVCSAGQRINCSTVIAPVASVRDTFDMAKALSVSHLSRSIVVSDGALCVDHANHVNVITVPPQSVSDLQQCNAIGVELDASSCNTIPGTCVCHWMCPSVTGSADDDLHCVIDHLYSTSSPTAAAAATAVAPRAIWSLFYNMELCSVNHELLEGIPTNLHITSDPTGTITYEEAVAEAKLLFKKICPDELKFIPEPPNPEDIIYEEEEQAAPNEDEAPQQRDGANKSETDEASDIVAHTDDQSDSDKTEHVADS
ncbi:rab proteins geranylgeranyltransferase component A 1-like isoform X2 [Dysidea avara]|uniref:rab proteins geranylgeranyltransferase component A 1-like isoform X2 n=1 Tax=Dysidea avara TaxID=196820 RepID=UPI003329E4F3